MPVRAILLVNFGGPRSEAEIPVFLENLTGNEPQPALIQGVATRYRAIGGCSPLPATTERLARLLSTHLAPENGVKAAFMYSGPSIDEVMAESILSGTQEFIVFILSPYYAAKTVGAYVKCASDCLNRLAANRPAAKFIHSWYANPFFIKWWVRQVRKEAQSSPDGFFLFSAHSLPALQDNDIYRSQVEETVRIVAERSSLGHYALAWQSAPLKSHEKWMAPSVEHVLDFLARRGVTQIIQVPIGFVMDNLETIYDIDITHKGYAEARGMAHRRLVCPNTDPLFVRALLAMLSDFLGESR